MTSGERKVLRQIQLRALQAASGVWSKSDHAELEIGVEDYVRSLRHESEIRFEKQSGANSSSPGFRVRS